MTNTKFIRVRLIQCDLTVNEAAAQLGLQASNLTAMIRGRLKLYRFRQPLAELLGVPVEKIFTDGAERPRPRGHRHRPRRRAAV